MWLGLTRSVELISTPFVKRYMYMYDCVMHDCVMHELMLMVTYLCSVISLYTVHIRSCTVIHSTVLVIMLSVLSASVHAVKQDTGMSRTHAHTLTQHHPLTHTHQPGLPCGQMYLLITVFPLGNDT